MSDKNTDRRFSLSKFAIFVAISSTAMGQTIVFTILSPISRSIGLTELQIGLIVTASAIAYTVFSSYWGRLSSVYGRRTIMLLGLIGYSLGTAVFVGVIMLGLDAALTLSAFLISLLFARVFHSFISSATSPAATAYIADHTDAANRTKGMAIIATGHGVGSIVGPALVYFSFAGLFTPLYIVASLTFLAAILVYFTLPKKSEEAQAQTTEQVQGKPFSTDGLSIFKPEIFPFLLIGVVIFSALSTIQICLSYYLQDALSLTAGETTTKLGLVLFVGACGALVGQVVFVYRLKLFSETLIKLGLSLMSAALLVLLLGSSIQHFSLGMLFAGLGLGVAVPGFMSRASLSVDKPYQGWISGWVAACPAAGYIIGPLFGSLLYKVHPLLPFGVVLAICLLLLVYVHLRLSKLKPFT